MPVCARSPTRWRVRLSRHALARRAFDVALEFDGDVDWADKNRLGLHLHSLRVRTGLIPMPVRDRLDMGAAALGRIARSGRHALKTWVPRVGSLRLSRRDASRP